MMPHVTAGIGLAVFLSLLAMPPGKTPPSKHKQYVHSPDGKLMAVIIPIGSPGYEENESRVEIRDRYHRLAAWEFSSEDGQHGYGVLNKGWSPDSRFFVFSTTSSGGHSAWHFPTHVYRRSDRTFRSLDDSVGPVLKPEFSFGKPDILTVTVPDG